MDRTPTRRRVVSTIVLVALAGCTGREDGSGSAESGSAAGVDGGSPDGSPNAGVTTVQAPDTTTGTADEGTPVPDDLDLREANVVDATFTADGESYRFDVTLYHDDEGEAGYADWWQVETLDGERLGRRTLLHAHSTAPFTRSETVTVPAGTDHVVVRGHDQTHGYGGQALIVDLNTGASESVRQGPEPRDFSAYQPRE